MTTQHLSPLTMLLSRHTRVLDGQLERVRQLHSTFGSAEIQHGPVQPIFERSESQKGHGLAKRPPSRGRWRPSQSVKSPNCLRRLAPQSRFVPAQAVKQARVKIGKAQESLGDGSGLQAWFERWMHGR